MARRRVRDVLTSLRAGQTRLQKRTNPLCSLERVGWARQSTTTLAVVNSTEPLLS